MRVIYMGTPDFAVGALEEIIKAGHEVALVVTQPDKPKGRGNVMMQTPVKECALAHGIPVYQPNRVREKAVIEEIKAQNPDVIIVIAFGQILPKEILEAPRYGCINIHASLLPKYRGAAPIQWAVINGEKITGVTTMQMDTGIDTGDILEQVTMKLDPKETGGSLFDKLSKMGGKLLLSTLDRAEAGTLQPIKQQEELASHARILNKQTGHIDFQKSAAEIERLIRGLNPWPSAFTHVDGKLLKIWDAEVLPDEEGADEKPGTVVKSDKNGLYIATGDGILSVVCLQLEGKKRMDVRSFLAGYTVPQGTVLV